VPDARVHRSSCRPVPWGHAQAAELVLGMSAWTLQLSHSLTNQQLCTTETPGLETQGEPGVPAPGVEEELGG
jgi:hypothetical protein